MSLKDFLILIPALEPDLKLIKLVKDLSEAGIENILIVNDGSSTKYDDIFQTAKNDYNCILLKHNVNLGKGRALKTAFNYILNELPDIKASIAVDSDGQHTVKDVIACSEKFNSNPDSLVLGTRNFQYGDSKIPFRSRFGNIITRNVIKIFCGINISDTQTGLRVVSRNLMKLFLNTPGERFEFEMNMLLTAKEKSVPIVEEKIETIYIEDNATSHFNPLLDSLRIYKIFGKYVLSSLSSTALDFLLFSIFISLYRDFSFYYIFLATISARCISSLYNYAINKKKVFKSKEKHSVTMLKYFSLVLFSMFLSSLGVWFLHDYFNYSETLCKVIVDSFIFVFNFYVQREFVFKQKKRR